VRRSQKITEDKSGWKKHDGRKTTTGDHGGILFSWEVGNEEGKKIARFEISAELTGRIVAFGNKKGEKKYRDRKILKGKEKKGGTQARSEIENSV